MSILPATKNYQNRYRRKTMPRSAAWTRDYLRWAAAADLACASASAFVAAQVRFGRSVDDTYTVLSLLLPAFWLAALWLSGGYDVRFIGTGSDEFRKILSAGVSLTALIAICSYAVNIELSRGYVAIALPCVTLFDLLIRFGLRKNLHRLRLAGRCMQTVVAVGHERAVRQLISELRRDRYHGLTVVAACLALPLHRSEVAGVPVYGGLDDVTGAVRQFEADTVAVLACPEIDGVTLRRLAWQLD
jgi:FlaA1/EpsC-like NDP-sugar epimerase